MRAFMGMNDARLIGLFPGQVDKDKIGHMEFRIRNDASVLDTAPTSTAPATDEAVVDTTELVRELDHRVSDRIDVWLRWRTSDDLLFVEVADGRTGDRFVVEVLDGDRPLDVFHHPYAYAAVRGTDLGAGG
jgi:hypothetical protein